MTVKDSYEKFKGAISGSHFGRVLGATGGGVGGLEIGAEARQCLYEKAINSYYKACNEGLIPIVGWRDVPGTFGEIKEAIYDTSKIPHLGDYNWVISLCIFAVGATGYVAGWYFDRKMSKSKKSDKQ